MASVVQPRQPFAALDTTRLQALGSVKNRQNAITAQAYSTSPSKGQLNSPLKRRLSPEPFDDDFDTENIDPNILFSPSKKGKAVDGTPVKASKFALIDAPKYTATPKFSPFEGLSSVSTGATKPKPKTLSLSVPNTTNSTPISRSRGSPKHKRVGLLSKRRFSSSPFRRADPPSSTCSLPFSIDAALQGTLTSYKPAQQHDIEDKPMPKSWFFDIHVDSPEEEAANMMEHSASILDISSDDDSSERRRKLEAEKGKENVPPPDWTGPVRAPRAAETVHRGICDAAKKAARLAEKVERMEEDRAALKEMEARDFYPEGLDEGSVVLVEEKEKMKGSGLSKETFDFEVEGPPSPSKELEEAVAVKGEIAILADEP